MYIVKIYNNGTPTEIHGNIQKLSSGKIAQGINSIDSFQFSILPSNIGFSQLHDYVTLVEVYNTNKNRYEFFGRVLYSAPSMSESGLIAKDVVCESFLGFLCDSQQHYVAEKNWTVGGLFQHIINDHNKQVESHKQFIVGEITVTDPNDNVYIGIQRENTWETIKKKLIETLGGEIRFRVDGNKVYIDYLTEIGEHSETEIAVSKNMKSISQEKDPTEIVTRLIPLGCKLKETQTDEEGNTQEVETEYRLTIEEINDGKDYIDDETAIELYGIRVGTAEFDDITVPSTLKARGYDWLAENNKLKTKYSVTALDLSLLGLDIDDFCVGNYHPLKNPLIDVDDTARIVKKNIDICEEIKSTIELGEKFDALSDINQKNKDALNLITSEYVTNTKFASEIKRTETLIKQTEEDIKLEVIGTTDYDKVISMINLSTETIYIGSNHAKLVIDTPNFKLNESGKITANAGKIAGFDFTSGGFTFDETETEPYEDITIKYVKNTVFTGSSLEMQKITYEDSLKLHTEKIIVSAGGVSVSDITTGTNAYYADNYLSITTSSGTCRISPSGSNFEGVTSVTKGSYKTSFGNSAFTDFYYSDTWLGCIWQANSSALQFKTSDSVGLWLYTGEDGYLDGTWYLSGDEAVTSDRNYKHDINDMPETYSVFFDGLRSVIHKYNDGKSDRYHAGFIAQEVDEALTAAGLTRQDFAGVCITKAGTENERWALRYSEFIPILTNEIQKLKKEIQALKGA